jgi:hypothetical protein
MADRPIQLIRTHEHVEKEHCLRLARTLGHDWTEGDLAHRFEIERAAVRDEAGMLNRVLEHELDVMSIELKAQRAQNKSLGRALLIVFVLWALMVLVVAAPFADRSWTIWRDQPAENR